MLVAIGTRAHLSLAHTHTNTHCFTHTLFMKAGNNSAPRGGRKKRTKAEENRRLVSGLHQAYKNFQVIRAFLGDFSALLEMLMEAGCERITAEMAVDTVSAAYSSTKDLKAALNTAGKYTCGNCGVKGHNRRTCRGFEIENLFER